MKIGHSLDKPALAPVAGRGSAAETGGANVNGAAPQGSSRVELSSAAASLLGSDGVQGANADMDTAKVERITQSIQDGSYQVNAEAIADKLLANARELLGRSH